MKRAKRDMEEFCASSSQQFEEMVANLDLPDFDLGDPANPQDVPMQSACQQPPDFNRLYSQISLEELKTAAATLSNRSSSFDLAWEYYLGQLSTGIEALKAQSVNSDCVFALSNMAEHLRTEQRTIRSCSLYSVLHLIRDKNKEELGKAAKARARERAKQNAEVQQALKNLVPIPLEQIKQQVQQVPIPQLQVPVQQQVQPKKQSRRKAVVPLGQQVQEEQQQQQQQVAVQQQSVPVLKIKLSKKSKRNKRETKSAEQIEQDFD